MKNKQIVASYENLLPSVTILTTTGQRVFVTNPSAPTAKSKSYFAKPCTDQHVEIAIPYVAKDGTTRCTFQRVRKDKLKQVRMT